MSEPRTKAGRRLLARLGGHGVRLLTDADQLVLDIEDQAQSMRWGTEVRDSSIEALSDLQQVAWYLEKGRVTDAKQHLRRLLRYRPSVASIEALAQGNAPSLQREAEDR